MTSANDRSGNDRTGDPILPDPKHYRFLKSVLIPLSASTVSSEVRDWLVEGRRVRFTREKSAAEESSCLRAECHRGPYGGTLIGYVPRSDAEKWAARMEDGVCLAGWIGPEGCSSSRIRIAVYERIVFPPDELASLEFRQSGLFHPFISVKLSFLDKTLVYRKSAELQDAPVQQVSIRFYPRKWDVFIMPALRRCNFPAWRSRYVDPCVCDGVSWSMELLLRSGVRRRILGSNDFPEEWEFFQSFLEQCLDMRDIKGSGTFSILPPDSLRSDRGTADPDRGSPGE